MVQELLQISLGPRDCRLLNSLKTQIEVRIV